MTAPPTPPALDRLTTAELLEVTDQETAELFRRVHHAQFSSAANPRAVVDHFTADHVLLDPGIHAVVVLDNGQPAAAGYRHTTDRGCGLYWIATVAAFRNRGHGGRVSAALLSTAPADAPVVLQATRLGRPVYRRQGFEDHGMLWCWAIHD